MTKRSSRGAAKRSQQLARYGAEAERKQDPMVRLGKRIAVLSNGCWEFGGDLHSYGLFSQDGYGQKHAHRRVYEILVGPIPDDHVIHHECGNRGCVNPKHLTPMLNGDHVAHHAALRRQAS